MTETIASQQLLARWIQTLQPSPLQDLLAARNADMISFALGLPSQEFFPLEAFRRATLAMLAHNTDVFQYMTTTQRLKQHIVRIMQMRGIQCREEQIFLTAGAQQGLSLLTHLLLDPGAQVMTEAITYTGILRVIAPLGPEIVTVPTNSKEGIDVNAVEHLLRAGVRPAFLYLVADGHNPLAVRISWEKRQYLADLVRHYQIPLIEDDPYSFLAYEPALPPIRALEDRWVFYVGSLSKVLAPALRIGWIVLPEDLSSKMSAVKEAIDLDIATFAQHVATWFLDYEDFPAHLHNLQQGYRQRRDITGRSLQHYLPQEVRWREPSNGMYFWLELPAFVDTGALLQQAILTAGVSFTPGHAFSADRNNLAANGLRVCFSHCPVEMIEEGISRLARVIAGACAQRSWQHV